MRVIGILPMLALSIPVLLRPAPASAPDITLAVPGAANQTPAAAALGSFVAVAWSAQPAGGKADVYVAVSRDGGQHFGQHIRVNTVPGEARVGGELPPRIALVARTGSDPEIVVAYGSKIEDPEIKVARSRDGGRTFTDGQALQANGARGDRGWHALALDATGTAHVMWLDHRGLAAARSGDHAHHEAEALDGVAMAQRSGLYYAREGGGIGAAGGERELLKGVCYCCKVALATGRDGSVVAAWRHVYPGNIRDIAFIASRDGGRSFEEPIRVSDDQWQLAGCPDDGPAMSLDDGGTVHIVWPTVIGGNRPVGALFYASSSDGRGFTPRVRVPTLGSPRPMHPQILVTPRGTSVAWDEVVDGVRQAAVRTVTHDEGGHVRFGAARRLGTPGQPSFYPVLVGTPEGVMAIWVSGAPGATVIRAAYP